MKFALILIGISSIVQIWQSTSYLMNKLRRYVARVAYDGSNFRGFQAQEQGLRTVQGTLSEVFSARCNHRVSIFGASRTDTGVHAQGQAFHFHSHDIADIDTFEYSINAMLPIDVKVYNTSIAPVDSMGNPLHACGGAKSKWYSYTFCNKRFIDPMKAKYCGHAPKPLDLDLFLRSLQLYVGTHDFRAFGNRLAQVQEDFDRDGLGMELDTTRTVQSIKLTELGDGYFNVDFHLLSALHKMVRNMMGTSWCVASGDISLDEQIRYLEEAADRRTNRGHAAPAEGLCLQKVFYENYD